VRTAFAAFLFVATFSSPALARPEHVTAVHDGDTFSIAAKWGPYKLPFTVRLLATKGGIDTPEIGSRARCDAENESAIRARDFTKTMIDESHGLVWLRRVRHDKYGGRIDANAMVRIKGKLVSLGDSLVSAGLAVVYDGVGMRTEWCASREKQE
jgi:micrococcal nuclease